jgi:hypothetical protein
VDVYQSDHHGLDLSNNPVLIKTLAPTVAVVNNGARKAASRTASPPSKRNRRSRLSIRCTGTCALAPTRTPRPELTANMDEQCKANFIHMVVDSKGNSYRVSIPGTGHERAFKTGGKS